METIKFKIAGKEIKMAYCYATEIAFYNFTGKTVNDFISEINISSNPSPQDILYLVLSAITAYYESKNEESPVRDTDLMFNAEMSEVLEAFNLVIDLFKKWYKIPETQIENKKKTKAKN